MYNRINYSIVGIFVLLFGAGMIWFALWLAKYGTQDEYDTYKIEMRESVAGLSKDGTVKLHGVDVGKIKQMGINPKNVEVVEILLYIKKGTVIKEDMVAHTQMYGVTGLLSIEIDGGTNGAKTLQPTDTYIPIIKTEASYFSKLSDDIEDISIQGKKLLSDKNIETLTKTLEHLEKISSKGEAVELKAIDSMDQIDQTLKELQVSFKRMSDDFGSMKNRINPTAESLMTTSNNFNRVTLKVEKSLDRGDYNLKKILEPVTTDMQVLSGQIDDLAGELKQSPSDLLFKSRKPTKGPGE
ncbi:MAG: MlaD family protein [Sulfurovaceae bacterium]|nr:MlaD family protein [Sulfurovaceae bacterium]